MKRNSKLSKKKLIINKSKSNSPDKLSIILTIKNQMNMKHILFLAAICLALTSCADEQTFKVLNHNKTAVETKTFETYGPFCENLYRDERIEYGVNVGNVVWDIILCETIFVPVILVGWELYEPVKIKPEYDPDITPIITPIPNTAKIPSDTSTVKKE